MIDVPSYAGVSLPRAGGERDHGILHLHGRIADEGSHDDLLTRLGTYRRLYELQFIDLDAPKQDAEGVRD